VKILQGKSPDSQTVQTVQTAQTRGLAEGGVKILQGKSPDSGRLTQTHSAVWVFLSIVWAK
jgi:hypothetical protein